VRLLFEWIETYQMCVLFLEFLNGHYNQTPNHAVRIDDFMMVTVDLAAYSVIYELRVKPSAPVFPESIRSGFMRLLHEKYGEDLATPMILDIRK